VIIYGINPVLEALRAGRVKELRVGDRADDRLKQLLALAAERGVRVRRVPADALDRESRRGVHQGVVADVETNADYSIGEIVSKASAAPFLVVLDGIEDPHNLGALMRSANGAGVDGVVIPERRAAGITGTVVKASAGASESLSVARVVNIARTLEDLKERNVWVVGLDERGTQSYDELDYNMDVALVFGAEGKGLHDLVRKKCDLLVSIPMMGQVSSLNVSVAGGIVMYEALRQRRNAMKKLEPYVKSKTKPK